MGKINLLTDGSAGGNWGGGEGQIVEGRTPVGTEKTFTESS